MGQAVWRLEGSKHPRLGCEGVEGGDAEQSRVAILGEIGGYGIRVPASVPLLHPFVRQRTPILILAPLTCWRQEEMESHAD